MRFLAILLLASPLAWSQTPAAHSQTYKVDASHTSIVFKVEHMGFSNVYGMIGGAEGKFTFDDAKPDQSTFDVTVKTDTISTFDKKRDEHLKGPDFFNTKQFPNIVLKSKTVKKTGASDYAVTGDLTMHGVTKPVSFTFKRMKSGKDPWGKTRTGGETTFTVKRTDFGMNFMSKPGEVGDLVTLIISIEGTVE